jgi:hypothetical protein
VERQVPHVTFGVAATVGIICGSLAYALASRTFRWEGFVGAEDTANHMIGGILMGFGGVTAPRLHHRAGPDRAFRRSRSARSSPSCPSSRVRAHDEVAVLAHAREGVRHAPN